MAFAGRTLSGPRFAGVVLGAGLLAAAGVGYWFFISQQRQYIVGRDFRLLSTLARQVDSTVQAEARVIGNLANDAEFTTDGRSTKALIDRWAKLRAGPYQPADIQFKKPPRGPDSVRTGYRFRTEAQLLLDVPLRRRGTDDTLLIASLRLQPVLESIFKSRAGQGAFDAIMLGTQDGRVLLSAGEAAQQLRSTGLGVLTPASTDGGKAVTFTELAQSTRMADVSLAGVDYTLFLFPCCMSSDKDARPLLLAGLVRAETLRSGSWAISTTLVKVCILGLLVAIVSWPFLKLILLGDRQQLRVSDFFQLGASSVAGLAIVTIVLLDVSAYLRLNRDTDVQLKELAEELDRHATTEVRDAYAQLECLERTVGSLEAAKFQDGSVSSALSEKELACKGSSTEVSVDPAPPGAEDRLDPGPQLPWAYPFFETVAFIDRNGMQQLKLGTSGSVSNRISVGRREYFRSIIRGRGWTGTDFCQDKCAFESVWSWTTGEPLAVLAKESQLKWGGGDSPTHLPVAAISIPMRSLIGPVLPPGFAFAVIDHTGKVLFHSDRQRNGREDLFVETDNNRRLRAQIAAHSAEPLNISYWGSEYRAYLKPMTLPDLYVVAMAQKERAWAINREWLVVTLIFVALYLGLWFIAAMATLGENAAWVWPDPGRKAGYVVVAGFCGALLVIAVITAWNADRNWLLVMGIVLPLSGWIGTYLFLRHRQTNGIRTRREPLFVYSLAALLVLVVTGVVPGALLFLASYQLHAGSYIKNSQLIVARRLSDRLDRLSEEFLSSNNGAPKPVRPAATQVGLLHDRDLYVNFLYSTSIRRASTSADDAHGVSQETSVEGGPKDGDARNHDGDMVLSFLEDYLPYYSEASVEWRELLHDSADDGSWHSRREYKGTHGEAITFTSRTGSMPVELTSLVPSIIRAAPPRSPRPDTVRGDERVAPGAVPRSVATTGFTNVSFAEPAARDSSFLLLSSGVALLTLAWGLVQILNRRVYLVGVTEPLWACGQLAVNAGENVFVLCDRKAKASQVAGMTPLKLGPIVQERDVTGAWRRALFALDESTDDGAVLIDDFDECLDDARGMERKLALLDELVSDQSRTVILVSEVSLRGLTDSMRHAARATSGVREKRASGQKAAPMPAGETTLERWRRVVKLFVVVERRAQGATRQPDCGESGPAQTEPAGEPSRKQFWSNRFDDVRRWPVNAFLTSEGRSHPYVRRICEALQRSNAASHGGLTRRQAFDEVAERTAQFYRGLWASCSEDEKVVLSHIARHGLANASVRSVVRRLLGRGLLCKDPALRPMNETFRRFLLTRECSQQVATLETENGPSAWDRLRAPLGVAVVGVAVFLFATQKELYNAILGVTTAAAVSVPTLIRAVGMLVGRPGEGTGTKA